MVEIPTTTTLRGEEISEIEVGQYWIDALSGRACLKVIDVTTDGVLFENTDPEVEGIWAQAEIELDRVREQVENGTLVYSPIDRNEIIGWLDDQKLGEEYYGEAEHGDGLRYWQYMDDLEDAKDDYRTYIEHTPDGRLERLDEGEG